MQSNEQTFLEFVTKLADEIDTISQKVRDAEIEDITTILCNMFNITKEDFSQYTAILCHLELYTFMNTNFGHVITVMPNINIDNLNDFYLSKDESYRDLFKKNFLEVKEPMFCYDIFKTQHDAGFQEAKFGFAFKL